MSVVTLFTCDMCQREVFESRAALHRHVVTRHAAIVPDSSDLAKLTEQLQPVLPELLKDQHQAETKWKRWGEMTLDVAAQRDAGPERLAEACDARRQLEAVVQRWRSTARVYIFGSSVAMGVWDGLSDIDFTVIDVDAMDDGEWPPNERNAVRGVANHLRRIGFAHPYLEAIEHARVPIIKHTAPAAFNRALTQPFEGVLSRSVRFLFDTVLDERDMRGIEAGVEESLQMQAEQDKQNNAFNIDESLKPERVWWDVVSGRHVLGVTTPTTTQAIRLLISPPATISASSSSTSSNSSNTTTNSSNSNNGKQTPVPLKRKAPVACLPVHEELRPELFRIDFDLSFRAFGVRNSLLLRHYLVDCHPCARPGALVLKDWSKTCGINDSMHGYLTSYAVNILWIYFLVQQGLVQFKDPQSVPESVRGVDPEPKYVPLIPADINIHRSGSNQHQHNIDNDSHEEGEGQPGGVSSMLSVPKSKKREELCMQMGRLLVEFFAFYCFTFNWERDVVSLSRPGVTTKKMLQWGESNETTLSPGGRGNKNTRYDLCIEDPYEDNLNLGRHIGAVRSRKFHDEFKRALLALVKGDFSDSCVFPNSGGGGNSEKKGTVTNDSSSPPPSSIDTPESKSSKNNQQQPSSSSSRIDDLTALLQVALDVVKAGPEKNEAIATTAELRAAFTARAPDAFERMRNSMSWLELTRMLGLRVVGDIVKPFRSVSAMRKKIGVTDNNSNSQQQSRSGQQQQQQQSALPDHRKEVDFVSLDLSDRILATFVRDLNVDNVELLPQWMKLQSQNSGNINKNAFSGGGSGSDQPANDVRVAAQQQQQPQNEIHGADDSAVSLSNSSASCSAARLLLRRGSVLPRFTPTPKSALMLLTRRRF